MNKIKKISTQSLIFFGGPGVGKGTYGKLFAKKHKFQKISTGDEIRALVDRSEPNRVLDPKLRAIKMIIDAGKYLDDQAIQNLLETAYERNITQHYEESKNGVIFDGYPRTIGQFKNLVEMIDESQLKIVNFTIPDHIIGS